MRYVLYQVDPAWRSLPAEARSLQKKELADLHGRINATELGRHLRPTYSYLAMTRPSQYLGGHRHEGQEDQMPAGPVGSTYLFVYPMVKKREWYALPFEERRRIMGAHFKIG